MKFDVIVGNPPYQEPSKNREGESSRSPKRFWEYFVDKAIEISNYDGVVALITPSGWLSSMSASNKILREKHILVANLTSRIKEMFGVGGSMRFSYFIFRNRPAESDIAPEFIFDDMIVNKNLLNMRVTPHKSEFGIEYSIVQKMLDSGCKPLKWLRRDDVKEPSPRLEVIMYRTKSTNVDAFISTTGDEAGALVYVPASVEEAKIVTNNINLKLYRRLRWTIRTGMAIGSTINYLPIPNHELFNDESLYDFFKLNSEEKKFLRSVK